MLLLQFVNQQLSQTEVQELHNLLTKHSHTALDSLIQSFTRNNTDNAFKCPAEWREIIKSLASSSPVCALIHNCSMYELINEETIEEHTEELSYVPQLTLCRNRGQYEADRVKSSRICAKYSTGHQTLLPGIFTLYCEHGI